MSEGEPVVPPTLPARLALIFFKGERHVCGSKGGLGARKRPL